MARQKSINLDYLDSITDIDSLLNIASAPKPKKIKKEDPEVLNFINEVGIKSGKTRVPTYIIYYRYTLWKKNKLKTRKLFFKHFAIHFKKTQVHHGVGYLLNGDPFDLTPQGFFKARALLRKERHDRQKEKAKA